ncbi:hypothetical protein Gogos_012908 [Gossypium gossypioides]|uniref:Uncharacterized protein n=1 Tax=Gossypium gossypioides TaxID=34282 RepID=A0A7J9BTZ3_GOSGO|nr:hypothetical protein [Gossypium gossypioides]
MILYRFGDFEWVSLLGIWGAIGYAPLLTRRMKRLAVGPMTTPEHNEWWVEESMIISPSKVKKIVSQ